MTITVPLTSLRPNLPKIMDRVSKYFDRYIITRHGKPEAVLLSEEDYESLLETVEILSDREAVMRIKRAKRQIKQGKTISLEELRRKIEKANV